MRGFFGQKPTSSEESKGLLDQSLTAEQNDRIQQIRNATSDNIGSLIAVTAELGDFQTIIIKSDILQDAANQYYETNTDNNYKIIKEMLTHNDGLDQNLNHLPTSENKADLELRIRNEIRQNRTPERESPRTRTINPDGQKVVGTSLVTEMT